MNIIYTSDWHLTDESQNKYRWDIFPWLEKQIVINKVDYLIHAGDLTDRKDGHSSKLVNNLVSHFQRLAKQCRGIFLLKGNHDYVDADLPYFRFLHRALNGKLLYFHRPAEIGLFQRRFLFLPHTRDWSAYRGKWNYAKYDVVLIHQPIIGAKGENGLPLTAGLDVKELATAQRVYAGDIHVPQQIGKVQYTGAPYPVRYGDDYSPSVILETEKGASLLRIPAPKKRIVEISYSKQFPPLGFSAGDMVKINVALAKPEFARWPIIRRRMERYCKAHNIRLGGLRLVETPVTALDTPQGVKTREKALSGDSRAILRAYGKAKNLPEETVATGLGLLD